MSVGLEGGVDQLLALVDDKGVADNTRKARGKDVEVFLRWCRQAGLAPFPATVDVVAGFVADQLAHCALATVRRRLSTISLLHNRAGVANPVRAEAVSQMLRRASKSIGGVENRVKPLNRDQLERVLSAAGGDLRDVRDKALLSMAYDTLCRRSELARLDVGDLQFRRDGFADVRVVRDKEEGDPAWRLLVPDTASLVRLWLHMSEIREGGLFRAIDRAGSVRDRLSDRGVVRAFKRLYQKAGLDPDGISGLSCRVGAAQDMVAAGFKVNEVMEAGGWRSPIMVARYGKRMMEQKGAIARLAARQGRI